MLIITCYFDNDLSKGSSNETQNEGMIIARKIKRGLG